MASSAHKQHQDFPTFYGATPTPPPTPSMQPNHHHLPTSAAAADTLARLLQRLPPTLSLTTRRRPSAASPPLISLSAENANTLILSSSSELGFFQLTDHTLSPQLARSAESEARSLFDLTKEEKESHFPGNWPLGFHDHHEEEDDGDETVESLCLDATSSIESTQFELSSLNELSRGLQKLGLEVIDKLATIMGVVNPFSDDPTRMCSFLWISEGSPAGSYPYVVALQYQIRCQRSFLLADSGPVSVLPQLDSVMVAIGDIAQNWSDGKLKKVRGIPKACLGDGDRKRHSCYLTMSLLLTFHLDNMVPLLLRGNKEEDEDEDDINGNSRERKEII